MIFTKLYHWTIALTKHRLAETYLAFIGFIESIFFPIPADIMLAPMCLSQPQKAYRYATILSIASIAGGVFGYGIGYFFIEWAEQLVATLHKTETLARYRQAFNDWGIALVFVAGFSPFPYKIATIGSGMIPIAFPLFFIGSVLSRPLRFFLVAWAIRKGGRKLEETIRRYAEWLGWLCVFLVAIIIISLYY
ncbi:YqaA family protein [Ostreibacterium oceani]|uniref:DedA family protein n=1 Tax=Ostreibacterium oceani TaxID=2654998 RepID=A0A6N7EVW6_9GAMM|nr:YqaA family protein [Ostreibacterium oceani]MPV85227.1 DedA family protein [Ostreibacterium oceani]